MSFELFQAIRRNASLEEIGEIIASRPELLNVTSGKMHILHYACCFRPEVELIARLLDAVPEGIYARAGQQETPLHSVVATTNGAPLDTVKLFVEKAPELLRATDSQGWTPLAYAFRYGASLSVTEYLMNHPEAEGCLEQTCARGWTMLHVAGRYGSLEVIKALLQIKPDLLDAIDDDGRTPLQCAMYYQAPYANIHYLIEREFERHQRAPSDMSPLLSAIESRASADVIELLLDLFPDSVFQISNDDWEETLLHASCRFGSTHRVAEQIVEHYPMAVAVRNKHGQTPLHIVCDMPPMLATPVLVKIASTLIKAHTKNDCNALQSPLVRYVDEEGLTALHLACKNGELGLVRLLLDLDPDAISVLGGEHKMSCLHFACQYFDNDDAQRIQVVKYLVEKRPDLLRIADEQGRLPLHYALAHCANRPDNKKGKTDNTKSNDKMDDHRGAFGLVQYLVSKFAEGIVVEDKKGRNAFQFACDVGVNPATMHLLISTNPFHVVDSAFEMIKKKSVVSRMA